VRQGDEPALK